MKSPVIRAFLFLCAGVRKEISSSAARTPRGEQGRRLFPARFVNAPYPATRIAAAKWLSVDAA